MEAVQNQSAFKFVEGLRRIFANDRERLNHGMVIYDALYAWLKHVRLEKHDWNPQRHNE